MKLYILPAILVLLIAAACNNDDNKHAGHNGSGKEPQNLLHEFGKRKFPPHKIGVLLTTIRPCHTAQVG